MNRRDTIIGAILIIFLGAALVWFLRNKVYLPKVSKTPIPFATTTPSRLEDTLRTRFNIEVPENQERIELKDVAGGDATGLATRKFENGKYSLVVLADLPDPEPGSFYEVWLVRGQTEISVGKLTMAKGGWLLDYETSTNYSDYNKVVVTKEKVNDGRPETKILEASF